jgi:hypothetical protein
MSNVFDSSTQTAFFPEGVQFASLRTNVGEMYSDVIGARRLRRISVQELYLPGLSFQAPGRSGA